MAPFLSFTAEEAWTTFGTSESIFLETFSDFGTVDDALLAKWSRIIEIRNAANKELEVKRAQGLIGSSLQAYLYIQAGPEDLHLLDSLGSDIKFVFITSKVVLSSGSNLSFEVGSAATTGVQKCERCWHYPDYPNHVGVNADHPTICGRCVSNLHGAGETRSVA
jgi:isoleucyl-tRNA synthetase